MNHITSNLLYTELEKFMWHDSHGQNTLIFVRNIGVYDCSTCLAPYVPWSELLVWAISLLMLKTPKMSMTIPINQVSWSFDNGTYLGPHPGHTDICIYFHMCMCERGGSFSAMMLLIQCFRIGTRGSARAPGRFRGSKESSARVCTKAE